MLSACIFPKKFVTPLIRPFTAHETKTT
ncbi:hypothetical protein EZS27_020740, partial [termite gut metagenome]